MLNVAPQKERISDHLRAMAEQPHVLELDASPALQARQKEQGAEGTG